MNRLLTLKLFTAGAAGVFAFLSGAACLPAQEFVVRDRVAEARDRILGSQNQVVGNQMPGNQLVIPVQSNAPAFSQANAPAFIQDLPQSRIQASSAMYATTATMPLYEEENHPQSNQQEEYAVSVMDPVRNEPYYDTSMGHSLAQISNGQSGLAGEWSSQVMPGVVWSNTHYYQGPSGPPGIPVPFAYYSAYARSGRGPEEDAAGNPMFCDDWSTSWPCKCCDEPVGLACFRPHGHAKKSAGHCGKHGCNGSLFSGKAGTCACGCGK